MKKKIVLIILSLSFVVALLFVANVNSPAHAEETPVQNQYYTVINSDGSVKQIKYDNSVPKTIKSNDYKVVETTKGQKETVGTYDTYEQAQKAVEKKKSAQPSTYSRARTAQTSTYSIQTYANTKAISYGVAKIIGLVNYTEYDGTNKGRVGYTSGTSANDAAYIGTFNNGQTVRVKQAGVFMDMPASQVEVTEYTSSSKVSYYSGKSGKFYHYYYSGAYSSTATLNSTLVGYTPSYLKDGTKYYSYDGHYFYTSYTTMINDYKAGVQYHKNAVNASKPYYNYYQYLSFRSESKFTATDLNNYINNAIKSYSKVDDSSKLKNQGQTFLSNQKNNGVNASLVLGIAINESTWGMSFYAQDRNNVFGIGAYDSNTYKAFSYNSVDDCLQYLSYNLFSQKYFYCDHSYYRGSHLGDKESGVNVKYASDPYWGEKAASFSYLLNDSYSKKDYQKYTIAVNQTGTVSFYKDEACKTFLYDSTTLDTSNKKVYDFPVTVLSQTGSAYKALSDTTLNSSRSDVNVSAYFNKTRDYIYLKTSDVILTDANTLVTYLKGDVNGDGKVSSLDYIQIKNHIMNTKKLTGDALKRADVNGDGKVSSLDYIKIKNHIMGTNKLF